MRRALPACLVVLIILPAAPAQAELPLVPLLTGGELRAQGSLLSERNQTARNQHHDPPSPEECSGPQCGNYSTLSHQKKAALTFDTRWLLDGRYPGVPVDPNASALAFSFKERPGTWHYYRRTESTNFPNDQGDGGGPNSVTEQACDTAIIAPAGAELPLLPEGEGDADGGFDAALSRQFYVNAFGSSRNEALCGPRDEWGVWLILGLVPSEGRTLPWDLGTEPREQRAWDRHGLRDDTSTCTSGLFTDGSPSDSETCTEHVRIESQNRLECALCVTDIKYEHHDDGGSRWTEVPDEGTWDGNEVRVTALIENRHTKTLSVPVLLRDRQSKRKLEGDQDNERTVTFSPGAVTKVEFTWRTDGWAWEKEKPRSERDVQILTPYGGAQQRIIVRPRPVVLVHGWNSDASTWNSYEGMLKAVHPRWKAYAVGDGQVGGKMDTDPSNGASLLENALSEHRYVANLRKKLDADHVDLVVHSMGGLISRQYIHSFMPNASDGRPVARRLVMLGTPNMGSPCADLIGFVARGIPTEQLKPGYATHFNRAVVNRRGVFFSVIAGDVNFPTCQSSRSGDTVVEVESAYWTLSDVAKNHIIHTDMPSSGHLVESFVTKRLALDPDHAKKLGAGGPAAGRVRAAGGAGAANPQAVAIFSRRISGRRDFTASFPRGARPAFAFLAPPAVTAALVDPRGRVVETQKAGSRSARGLIRYIDAPSKGGGVWRLRLKGDGAVRAVAVLDGGAASLTVKAVQPRRPGPVAVSARLTDKGRLVQGATMSADLVSARGRRVRIQLHRGRPGYAGRTGKLPAGPWFVTVGARKGQLRLMAATQTR